MQLKGGICKFPKLEILMLLLVIDTIKRQNVSTDHHRLFEQHYQST